MRSATPLIDYSDPINRDHHLAENLVSAWLMLPQRVGTLRLLDLVSTKHGTLVNFDPAGGLCWRGTNRPGGWHALVGHSLLSQYILTTAVCTSGTYTVSAWFWFYTLDLGAAFFSAMLWFVSGSGYSGVGINSPGGSSISAPLQIYGSGAGEPFGAAVGTWPDTTTWHHFAMTRTASAYTTYLDGVEIGNTASGTWGAATEPLNILGRSDVGSQSCHAFVNDPMFWDNRALSAREVAQLYHESRQGYPQLLRRTRRVGYSLPAAPAGSALLLRLQTEGLFTGSGGCL